MEIPNDIEERLSDLAEKHGRSYDDIEQDFTDEVTEVHEQTGKGREFCQRTAIRALAATLTEHESTSDKVEVLAIGNDGTRPWTDKNHEDYEEGMDRDEAPRKEILIANGLIRDDDGRISRAVFAIDETDGLDLGAFAEAFQPLNTLTTEVSLNECEGIDGYRAFSVNEASLELGDVDDFPSDEEAKREILNKQVPKAELRNIMQGLSMTEVFNGREQVKDWGVDIKRVDASVIDVWVSDDGERGAYTVLDDSIVDESELEGTPVDSESSRSTGLTCWCEGDLMEYGKGSLLSIYGVVKERFDREGKKTGEVAMDVRGIDPVYAKNYEDKQTETAESETW